MIVRDDLVATYSVDYVAGVMSLRKPQKESLLRLEKIWNAADIRKGADLTDNLARVKELYPLCKDFERAFPSLAFALATGVGKTRLMGAFITWLYAQKGVRNFFIVAPGMTVYEKLKSDFGNPNSPKYVFKGVGCFTASPPVIVADDDYRQKRLSFTDSSVRIFIFNRQVQQRGCGDADDAGDAGTVVLWRAGRTRRPGGADGRVAPLPCGSRDGCAQRPEAHPWT